MPDSEVAAKRAEAVVDQFAEFYQEHMKERKILVQLVGTLYEVFLAAESYRQAETDPTKQGSARCIARGALFAMLHDVDTKALKDLLEAKDRANHVLSEWIAKLKSIRKDA